MVYRPVLCLPKTGSTSLTQWLQTSGERARHEWDALAVLDLGSMSCLKEFSQLRERWICHRSDQLNGEWDVNTALYAVLAEVPTSRAQALQMFPRWLCRSPRPWLRSILAWSMRFSSDPYRSKWLLLHHGFVARRDAGLAAQMPRAPGGFEDLLFYWFPVWLCFNELIIERGFPYRLTDQLPASHHVNASHLDPELAAYLEQLLPDLPALTGDPGLDRNCLHECRRCFDQLGSSRG